MQPPVFFPLPNRMNVMLSCILLPLELALTAESMATSISYSAEFVSAVSLWTGRRLEPSGMLIPVHHH